MSWKQKQTGHDPTIRTSLYDIHLLNPLDTSGVARSSRVRADLATRYRLAVDVGELDMWRRHDCILGRCSASLQDYQYDGPKHAWLVYFPWVYCT